MKKTLSITLLLTLLILIFTSCANGGITTVTLSSSDNGYKITKGGTYDISGELFGSCIEIDTDKEVKLILSGLSVQNDKGEAIKVKNASLITIELLENSNNTLVSCGEATILSNSNLEFCGNGNLSITSKEKHGIECEKNITVKSGNISIASFEHGIKSESEIHIIDGNIDIYSQTGKGIKAEIKFLADGGNINIKTDEDEGLESKGELTINDGVINIIAGEDGINAGTSDKNKTDTENNKTAIPEGEAFTGERAPEGAQPKNFRPEGRNPADGEGEQKYRGEFAPGNRQGRPMPEGEFVRPEGMPERPEGGFGRPKNIPEMPEGEFIIPAGTTTSGRGVPFEFEKERGGFGRVNEDSVITINGGIINITAEGDGIDSNGSLSINGGTVIINGPDNAGNGPLDSDGEMQINGATVLTCSAISMTQLPRSVSQGILSVTLEEAIEQGSVITIINENDGICIEHTTTKICEVIVFSSPKIKIGETYKIYADGIEVATAVPDVTVSGGFGGFGGGRGGNPGGMGKGPKGQFAPEGFEKAPIEDKSAE